MVEFPGRVKKNIIKKEIKKVPGRWLVLVVLLICELFIYTAVRVDCTRNRYQIFLAQEAQKSAQTYQRELVIELDRLGAPERIAKIARSRLNLEMPDQGQVVYMD
ncbi:MAG: cell division protein FtsL [Desulfobacterium sp.]|jgi:cell division protein FtsL|nr:cell division protein FtsL [Desulfobacterium sp.]